MKKIKHSDGKSILGQYSFLQLYSYSIAYLFPQCVDDGVVWVDLHVFLSSHVSHSTSVSQCLCLHNSLHVSRPAILTGYYTAW